MRTTAIMLLLALAGCAEASETPAAAAANGASECRPYLAQVAGNPETDAARNFAKGDRRVVVVHGFSAIVPPFGTAHRKLFDRFGRRMIEGTSDYIEDDSCLAFNRQAFEYARRYNVEIFRLAGAPQPPVSPQADLSGASAR